MKLRKGESKRIEYGLGKFLIAIFLLLIFVSFGIVRMGLAKKSQFTIAPDYCHSTDDCEIYLAPLCKKGGCSNVCGYYEEWTAIALNKKLADKYLLHLKEDSRKSCVIDMCMECYTPKEHLPKPDDVKDFKAGCIDNKCVAVRIKEKKGGLLKKTK